jgi:hypothetical protein
MDRSNWIHVEASHVVDARPEEVHAVIADFRIAHPAILPKQFTALIVEEGGFGAGTLLRGSVKMFGQEYPFRQRVSEPEPGRTMVEVDVDNGQLTKWTFEPLDGGARTRVTIASDFPPSKGIMSLLERLTRPPVTRALYNDELRILARYMLDRRATVQVARQ